MWLDSLAYIVGAYFLGTTPSGFIIYYILRKKDIRQEGSGNTGAANVLRLLGKPAATATLALDLLKGLLVAFYGKNHFDSPTIIWVGCAMVIIGHMHPFYLSFKGGKGISTFAGVMAVIHPMILLAAFGVFIISLMLTGFISAGSLAGIIAAFFLILFRQDVEVSIIMLILTLLVIYRHQDNIRRLYENNELKCLWNKDED